MPNTNELKQYHKNPRKISDKQMELLKKNLGELGDLSGVVHDLNSGEVIGGNQRTKVFNLQNAEIIITEQFEHQLESENLLPRFYSRHQPQFRGVMMERSLSIIMCKTRIAIIMVKQSLEL